MGTTLLEQFEQGQMQLTTSKPSYPSRTIPINWLPNLVIQKGTVIGVNGSNCGNVYNSTNTDGTQTPVGIARFSFVTGPLVAGQAFGMVYYVIGSGSSSSGLSVGTGAFPSTRATPYPTSDIFVTGVFNPNDIIGMDANAKTVLKVVTLPDGDYMIGGS